MFHGAQIQGFLSDEYAQGGMVGLQLQLGGLQGIALACLQGQV